MRKMIGSKLQEHVKQMSEVEFYEKSSNTVEVGTHFYVDGDATVDGRFAATYTGYIDDFYVGEEGESTSNFYNDDGLIYSEEGLRLEFNGPKELDVFGALWCKDVGDGIGFAVVDDHHEKIVEIGTDAGNGGPGLHLLKGDLVIGETHLSQAQLQALLALLN